MRENSECVSQLDSQSVSQSFNETGGHHTLNC